MAQKSTDFVVAKFSYKASDGHELGIQKGERLTLIDDSQHWWIVQNSLGQTGYVPSNFVKRTKQGIFSSLRNTLGRRKSRPDPNAAVLRQSNPSSPTPSAHENNNDATTNHSRLGLKHESADSIGPMSTTDTAATNYMSRTFAEMRLHGNNPVLTNHQQHYQQQQQQQQQQEQQQHHSAISIQPPSGYLSDQYFSNTRSKSSNCYGQTEVPSFYSQNPTSNESAVMASSTNQNGFSSSMHHHHPHHFPPPQRQSNLMNIQLDMSSTYGGTTASANRQICQARFAYPANQPDELSLERGDRIRVLEKSSDGWWRGALISDTKPPSVGWFPSNYVTLNLTKNLDRTGSNSQPSIVLNASATPHHHHQHHQYHPDQADMSFPNSQTRSSVQLPRQYHPPDTVCESVLTLYPFNRKQVEELSFGANEVLEVVEKPLDDPDWWKCRNAQGDIGLVPQNYVKILCPNPIDSNKMESTASLKMLHLQQQQQQQPFPTFGDGEALRLNYASRSTAALNHVNRPWFWGVISRAECELMLSQFSLPGEFIIRDSESHPGDLTITINAGNKARNFKVHVENGRYYIGQKVFNCINDLIEHYRTHPIFKNDQEKHYLTRPFVHPGPNEAGRMTGPTVNNHSLINPPNPSTWFHHPPSNASSYVLNPNSTTNNNGINTATTHNNNGSSSQSHVNYS